MAEVPKNHALRERLEKLDDEQLTRLLTELKTDQHNSTDMLDRQRTIRAIEIASFDLEQTNAAEPFPDIRPLILGIRWERSILRQRITERLRQRIDGGMIDEVQKLHVEGVPWDRLDYYGLEYRYTGAFLRGEMNRNDFFQRLNSAIHDFAKRQETWFRRMEKHGIAIHWVDGASDPLEQAIHVIEKSSQQ